MSSGLMTISCISCGKHIPVCATVFVEGEAQNVTAICRDCKLIYQLTLKDKYIHKVKGERYE